MAVKLIKTGGTNSQVNKDFYQYRQGNQPRTKIGKGNMPAPTTKNGRTTCG